MPRLRDSGWLVDAVGVVLLWAGWVCVLPFPVFWLGLVLCCDVGSHLLEGLLQVEIFVILGAKLRLLWFYFVVWGWARIVICLF